MVAAVRKGSSPREVAERFGVSLRTVQIWVARAECHRLDRIDWSDRPRGGRREACSTPARTEDLVVRLRKELKESSALGDCGKSRPIFSKAAAASGLAPLALSACAAFQASSSASGAKGTSTSGRQANSINLRI